MPAVDLSEHPDRQELASKPAGRMAEHTNRRELASKPAGGPAEYTHRPELARRHVAVHQVGRKAVDEVWLDAGRDQGCEETGPHCMQLLRCQLSKYKAVLGDVVDPKVRTRTMQTGAP